MNTKLIKSLGVFFIAFGFISCDIETSLDVENLESPSSKEIGVESTASKIFQNWYQTANSYDGPGMALATMADNQTCSWGNSGMRDLSSEPRVAWDNQSTYSNAYITETYFNGLHSVLADSNGLIASISEGANFSDPDKIESLARFGQAAAIGYLALVFDRVYLSDENGTINDGIAKPWDEAIDLAIEKLDLAIAAAERGSFSISNEINGTTLTNAQWTEFLNSFGARLLVNSPRNSTQKAAVNWDKVLAYANDGISYDLEVLGDGYATWYSEWMIYMIYPGWARTDLYVINKLDPTYPKYWPEGSTVLPEATPTDARLTSDYEYLDTQDFRPDRGTYHFTSYRHSRYDSYTNTFWEDFQPEMLEAENTLYKAEAQMRKGLLTEAAATINAGTRVTRGQLPAVAADATAIADAIHHERVIELSQTGCGLAFFEMRGKDLLQKGTLLHFPIPGAALDANKEESYTFGGSTGVAGEDYSNAGWR